MQSDHLISGFRFSADFMEKVANEKSQERRDDPRPLRYKRRFGVSHVGGLEHFSRDFRESTQPVSERNVKVISRDSDSEEEEPRSKRPCPGNEDKADTPGKPEDPSKAPIQTS